MAEKAEPPSSSPPPSLSDYRWSRDEIPLSRREGQEVLAQRVRRTRPRIDREVRLGRVCARVYVVWRSLTPPSKIGKGSGEPRIIDLCHKQNSGSSNQISERNSYIIFTTYARCARKRGKKTDGWCSEEESCLGCEGGYAEDRIYRCEGLSARGYSRPSERPRCVAILVSAKQTCGFELAIA